MWKLGGAHLTSWFLTNKNMLMEVGVLVGIEAGIVQMGIVEETILGVRRKLEDCWKNLLRINVV